MVLSGEDETDYRGAGKQSWQGLGTDGIFQTEGEGRLVGAPGGLCCQWRMMKPFTEMKCKRKGIAWSGGEGRERPSSAWDMLV